METILFQKQQKRKAVKNWKFNETDFAILRSFLIFPYLTAEQVCSLHYSPTSLKYVMARLAWLVEERYLNRSEKFMLYPLLYSLALRGTRKLDEQPIYYPLENKTVHSMHYRHLLLTNEVLMCALKLPLLSPSITLLDIRHDETIRHTMKGVRADGWSHFFFNNEHIPVSFEIHIGSRPNEPKNKDKEKFQAKIEGISESMQGEYQRVFGTEYNTVSFLTPYEDKVERLVSWTEERLDKLGKAKEADLFRFAHVAEKNIDPQVLFTTEVHRVPFTSMFTTLI